MRRYIESRVSNAIFKITTATPADHCPLPCRHAWQAFVQQRVDEKKRKEVKKDSKSKTNLKMAALALDQQSHLVVPPGATIGSRQDQSASAFWTFLEVCVQVQAPCVEPPEFGGPVCNVVDSGGAPLVAGLLPGCDSGGPASPAA